MMQCNPGACARSEILLILLIVDLAQCHGREYSMNSVAPAEKELVESSSARGAELSRSVFND